jgi:hypothetical protein
MSGEYTADAESTLRGRGCATSRGIFSGEFNLAGMWELKRGERFRRRQPVTSGALAMPRKAGQTVRRPLLNSTEAQLFVADIRAACDFYTKKLGFAITFIVGDPPFYGQVTRGRARLNLRVVGEPVFAGDIREREELLSASLTLATTDELEPAICKLSNRRSELWPTTEERAVGY